MSFYIFIYFFKIIICQTWPRDSWSRRVQTNIVMSNSIHHQTTTCIYVHIFVSLSSSSSSSSSSLPHYVRDMYIIKKICILEENGGIALYGDFDLLPLFRMVIYSALSNF